jgi:site-specific DNA-cytosine methylase
LEVTLTYGSVCSGIEAVTRARHPLEIQPKFPNLGDFTKIGTTPTVDVLVAGIPRQSFSRALEYEAVIGDRLESRSRGSQWDV